MTKFQEELKAAILDWCNKQSDSRYYYGKEREVEFAKAEIQENEAWQKLEALIKCAINENEPVCLVCGAEVPTICLECI